MFGSDAKDKEVEAQHDDAKTMAKPRVDEPKKEEGKKDEGKKEDKHDLVAEQKASVKKMEEASAAEAEETKHIRTGGADCHHHLLPEVGVQVVTDDKTKVTKAMPFVDTEVDHERAVKLDEK